MVMSMVLCTWPSLGDRELRERRHLHERADHPAVQGRQDGVADQVLGERQDGGHLVAVELGAHAEEPDVGHPLQEGVELLSAASLIGGRLSMKAPWAVAIRSRRSDVPGLGADEGDRAGQLVAVGLAVTPARGGRAHVVDAQVEGGGGMNRCAAELIAMPQVWSRSEVTTPPAMTPVSGSPPDLRARELGWSRVRARRRRSGNRALAPGARCWPSPRTPDG
jgi:hypothetical protein